MFRTTSATCCATSPALQDFSVSLQTPTPQASFVNFASFIGHTFSSHGSLHDLPGITAHACRAEKESVNINITATKIILLSFKALNIL
jgi:hypothetical protein